MIASVAFALLVLPQANASQQRDVPDELNAIVEYQRAADLLAQEPLPGVIATINVKLENYELVRRYEGFDLDSRRRLIPRIVRVYEAVQSGNARLYAITRFDFTDVEYDFTYLANIKQIARALVHYSEVLMADGKPNEAFEVLLAVHVMGRKLALSADVIYNLTGTAIQAVAVGPMDRNLQHLTLPAAENILANVPFPESSNDALKALIIFESANNRARMLATTSMWYPTGQKLIEELTEELERPPTKQEIDERIAEYESIKSTMERVNPKIYDMAAIVDLPEDAWYQAASGMTEIADESEELDDYEVSVAKLFFASILRNRTINRLLRLHAHITRYRWLHGRLPAGLDQLGEDDATLDPVTGGRFEYELRGETYDLYSRGFDARGPIRLKWGQSEGTPIDPDDPQTEVTN